MKTYDISDDMAAAIRAAGIDLPEPVCGVEERMVTSPQAMREHFEDADEEERDFLATVTDEQINVYLSDLYDDWARACRSALDALRSDAEHAEKAG